MNTLSIKLDKNYNILEEKGGYDDDFLNTVEEINKAESSNKISKREAVLLLNIVLKKELHNEAEGILPLSKKQPEIQSLFMNLKTKQTKHAGN